MRCVRGTYSKEYINGCIKIDKELSIPDIKENVESFFIVLDKCIYKQILVEKIIVKEIEKDK